MQNLQQRSFFLITGLYLSLQEKFGELALDHILLFKASTSRWLLHGSIAASVNRMGRPISPTYFAINSDKAIIVLEQQLDSIR